MNNYRYVRKSWLSLRAFIHLPTEFHFRRHNWDNKSDKLKIPSKPKFKTPDTKQTIHAYS